LFILNTNTDEPVGPGDFSRDPQSPVQFPDGGLPFDGLDIHVGERMALRRRVIYSNWICL